MDAGWLMFAGQRARLGGQLRLLVSADPVAPPVRRFFAGLGLPISEVFGFPEATAVLGLGKCKPGADHATLITPLPDVEFKVVAPDADGVGELWARGPNVMQPGSSAKPQRVIDAEGWLHTGQRGKLVARGRVELEATHAAGRAEVVTSDVGSVTKVSAPARTVMVSSSSPVPELRRSSESVAAPTSRRGGAPLDGGDGGDGTAPRRAARGWARAAASALSLGRRAEKTP
jgi:hypothetical protein